MTWGGHKLWKGTIQDESLEESKYREEVKKENWPQQYCVAAW
jgi:hypothetical protein